jgi:hypothetical protein
MTTDDILRKARNQDGIYAFTHQNLAEFVNLMIEAERKCCADLCDEVMAHYKEDTTLSTAVSQVGYMAAELCSVKIRGR